MTAWNEPYLGRVSMFIPKHKPRKLINASVMVSFWLNDRVKPTYSDKMFSYLAYDLGENEYRIYNPQKYKFDIEELKAHLVLYHRYVDGEIPSDFRVVKGS